MNDVPVSAPTRLVELTIDGRAVRVAEGSTILDACRQEGIDTPTLCWAENLCPASSATCRPTS
jgi:NADH dehydrogenase/NADH:ubiquinone oxidoreductase subunit G